MNNATLINLTNKCTAAAMTAESERIKALAGLLTNEDLYNDDLFFSGSVKQKQQVIVSKLSKSAPIKDNGVTSNSHHQSSRQKIDKTIAVSQIQQNDSNNNSENQQVQFGESSDQSIFVSSSVRERAAAMSGFLTKKKEGPTSGQARAMEWRGSGSNSNHNNQMDAPQKIAPTFVSQFDRVGENDANNGGTSPTSNKRKMMKKKSKPSFLFQFDDSPRADGGKAGNFEEENAPRAPLTPRTPRAPLTPRTPSRTASSNDLLSPRTPRQTTTPRGSRHRSNMLASPRAGGAGIMMNSKPNFEQQDVAAGPATAVLNSSMAVEVGSITEEIDDWFGGMSLSDLEEENDQSNNDSEEEDADCESNGEEDEFFMNDLDKVLSEANGFLENVVDSESEEEEEEEEMVHFGFNDDEDETVGMSDELESELESARQLAEGFTKFLVCDEVSVSPEVVSSHGSSRNLEEEEEEEEEEVPIVAWDGDEQEVAEEEEHDVSSASIEEEVHEEEEEEEVHEEDTVEEESVEDNAGDWGEWTRNNDFFANFDVEDEAAEDEAEDVSHSIAEPARSREEIAPTRVKVGMPRSETKSNKPKLRIQIKGAPELKPTKKENDEGAFFYASQPSPLARDDEQLLDTQPVVPSPVSVEPDTSETDNSPKKFDISPKKFHTSPKKFGFKKIVHRACPESDDDESVDEASVEEKISQFHAQFDMPATSLTKSNESEKKSIKSPPKLTIYIKGAPQFAQTQQAEEEDAFYFSQPSPLVGDDKGLLSSNFSSSPLAFEQKKEMTLTSSTKKHFKNFVSKTIPPKGNTKFDLDNHDNDFFSNQSGNNFFNDAFFSAAPGSPVRQAKVAMKENGSTKKKILGLLSGKKKKKQNRGLYMLDD